MDAVGQESGQGVSPHPLPGASHALVPVAAETATPLSSIPGCQQDLPPKDTSCPPLTGCRAGWGLWGPALSCGQSGQGQGECGHQEALVMMGGLEGLRAGGAPRHPAVSSLLSLVPARATSKLLQLQSIFKKGLQGQVVLETSPHKQSSSSNMAYGLGVRMTGQ